MSNPASQSQNRKTQKPRAPAKPAQAENGSSLLSPKAFLAFVVIGLALIVWMIAAAPKQKRLACAPSPNPSLIEFGRCQEE